MRDSREHVLCPVHTNPFSNENGAVLLSFQKDLRFRIVFARPRYNALSVLKLNTCAFQFIGPRNWREIEATW